MEVLYLVMFFLFGSVFGSFYNVLATRIHNHESIIYPPSHCERCHHHLSWYELIPILSFIIQKGECRECHMKLPKMYLFSEIGCGILFAISYYSFGFSYQLIIALILSSTMIVVTVSDLNYLEIPNRFIIVPSILILIVKLIFEGLSEFLFAIAGGVLAFLIMFMIMKIGEFIFKKECLGGADVKLMFLVGILLHPLLTLLVIILASFIALPVSLFLLFRNKESVIPFGPFIVLGLLIIFFMKIDVMKVLNFLLQK